MLQVYRQDSMRGFGIPAVISTSLIVPAASSCRLEPTGPGLRPGPGLAMWAGTTRPGARAYTTITLRGLRPNSPTGPAVRSAFLRVSGVTGQDPGPGLAPGRRPCRARHRPPAAVSADLNSPRPVQPDRRAQFVHSPKHVIFGTLPRFACPRTKSFWPKLPSWRAAVELPSSLQDASISFENKDLCRNTVT